MSASDPPGTFHYFAYGSNMLTDRLTAADRAPSARPIASGYVPGRRLAFDKVGQDGSGKCDAERSDHEDDLIFGVVFEIEAHDKPRLDRTEGVGNGYRREEVTVRTSCGSLRAVTYVATNKSAAVRPFLWYKKLVLAGAQEHALPSHHVEKIRAVEAIVDPDGERRAANLLVLSTGRQEPAHRDGTEQVPERRATAARSES